MGGAMWIDFWLSDRTNRHKPWQDCPGLRTGHRPPVTLTEEGLLLIGLIAPGRRIRSSGDKLRLLTRMRLPGSGKRRRRQR